MTETFGYWCASFQSPIARGCFWCLLNDGWFRMGNKVNIIRIYVQDDEMDKAKKEFSCWNGPLKRVSIDD